VPVYVIGASKLYTRVILVTPGVVEPIGEVFVTMELLRIVRSVEGMRIRLSALTVVPFFMNRASVEPMLTWLMAESVGSRQNKPGRTFFKVTDKK
jgi:hypothetical protein